MQLAHTWPTSFMVNSWPWTGVAHILWGNKRPCFLNLFHFLFIPIYHVFHHCWNVFFKAHNHLHPIYIILRFWLVFLWLCFSVLTHAYMCVNWVQLVTTVVNYIVCYNWELGHTVHLCNEPLYSQLHYYPPHIHVGLSCVMGT